MEKEMNEFVEALRGLKAAVVDLKSVVYDTNMKMSKAINDSHLHGTLTLLGSDIALRRMLEHASNQPYGNKRHA